MKFIFDFDDVLLYTTNGFRECIYSTLTEVGVSRDLGKEYIERERWNLFSLKKMLVHFSVSPLLYQIILGQTEKFLNKELVEVVKNIEKSNCYMVTYGDKEFQLEKVNQSGIGKFFTEIFTVQGSKKEAVEKICARHKNEEIVFIDDKAKHFEDLDFKKYPNLKTILYDEKGLEKLKSILSKL